MTRHHLIASNQESGFNISSSLQFLLKVAKCFVPYFPLSGFWSRDCTVVRALASYQYSGSISGRGIIRVYVVV